MTQELTIHSQAGIEHGLIALGRTDPSIKAAFQRLGTPEPRDPKPGFATLLRIIVGQQVSTQSAAAIWSRIEQQLDGKVCAAGFLDLGEEGWRKAGLSRPKMRYGNALARSIIDGAFDPRSVEAMDDQDAINALTNLLGFGRWSAEIYLMFALARPDILPADDIAIQAGYQQLKRLDARPKPQALRTMTEHWTPHRSSASLLLWHLYGSTTLDAKKPNKGAKP